MANPRQRRKARSSGHRPVSLSRRAQKKLKKAPPIRGPKLLQDVWDKKKTVRQNYATLGLVHNLNPTASGGTEDRRTREEIEVDKTRPPDGFGRIIRDEAGNIMEVELPPEDSSETDSEEMKEPTISPRIKEKWVTGLGRQSAGDFPLGICDTVKALECQSVIQKDDPTMSLKFTGAGARTCSTGELKYLRRLFDQYGDDVERMAKDRRMNVEQRTAGELRRALTRSGLLTGRGGDRVACV